ncbi:hypothetical protein GCM10022243_13790 [Saccharothrix violaceirubra]|uniref:NADH:ubiquinone oxidoreductase subunit 5 (Subunit L)/multisubunit Na+/H+ antiporter MnhA subunit n=1 Tax=Saccharothrix violaceirubra TaxID=413306 RepID=A0A7W7T626_9PSEU|nr:hypothetical protein [Saccharothrix violaceirubra]MBB4967253.1 NADH:ubiquinone oxidoreductase subunit 5 (subunit L)/multisubunit Na+/H+ antiporter MnhA subunit [Saccharothrix violaceirubra]
MIALAPIAVVLALLGAAAAAGTQADARAARRKAVYWTSGAAALAIAELFTSTVDIPVALVHTRHEALLCAAIALSGVLVAAMAPVSTHPPGVLARALLLVAVSCAFTVVRSEVVDLVLLAVSAWLAWSGLRGRPGGAGRLFALHQVPSLVLVAVGVATGVDVFVVLGLAIRAAAVPAHAWFPRFVGTAPMGLVVAFGTVPLGLVVPESAVATVIGVVTALCGAVFAVVQTDGRRSLAFLLVCGNGIVLAGGGWAAAVLAGSGLAMTVGALAARRDALSFGTPVGDLSRTPRLAVAYLGFGLALAGFPLLAGFATAHHLLDHAAPAAVACLLVAVAVAGIAVVRGFLALFTGTSAETGERDLTPLENYAVAVTLALLVFGGLLPGVAVL